MPAIRAVDAKKPEVDVDTASARPQPPPGLPHPSAFIARAARASRLLADPGPTTRRLYPSIMERRQIVFLGRVQGVGFRATTRDIARRHPVTGWVRNEPDGSVLAHFQGSAAAIDACLADLRRRMAGFITRETAAAIPPETGESGFEIRR